MASSSHDLFLSILLKYALLQALFFSWRIPDYSASKVSSASCNAGSCCIYFCLLQEKFSPLPSRFLDHLPIIICSFLPRLICLSGRRLLAACSAFGGVPRKGWALLVIPVSGERNLQHTFPGLPSRRQMDQLSCGVRAQHGSVTVLSALVRPLKV